MKYLRQLVSLFVALCIGFAPQASLAVLKGTSGVGPPGAVSITGGTIGGSAITSAGQPTMLAHSAIPFIWLSSGSVDATGNITGITALPRAYPRAWCLFPANILATVNAAGWKYCTFSTTTGGVAFLDTYTSGIPTIPSSPTAVTDGRGAFTGVTAETAGQTLAMPALTANDAFSFEFDTEGTNNANAKTIKTRYGSTDFSTATLTSMVGARIWVDVANAGNTATQIGSMIGLQFSSGAGAIATVPNLGTEVSSGVLNTSLRGTHATATDNLIVTRWRVVLYSNGT